MAGEMNAEMVRQGVLRESQLRTLVKAWQAAQGMPVTGVAGPMERDSLDAAFADADTLPPGTPLVLPPLSPFGMFDGPLEKLPRGRTEVYKVFGNPGAGTADPKWERENIVKVEIPGVPKPVRIHRLVEPYLREAVRRARAVCPDHQIQVLGGHVFRHMRHDPARPLSMHAFGCAVDVNPAMNAAHEFNAKNPAPAPFGDSWAKRWPAGLPRGFVAAFQSVGFAWGGNWRTFCDPMHFELVLWGDGQSEQV